MCKWGILFFSNCLIIGRSQIDLTLGHRNKKNPRYKLCSYWWPYEVLKLLYWSLKNYSYSNFTNCIGGRVTLTWPGDMGTKFSGNVRKGWRIRYANSGGASPFFRCLRKTGRGSQQPPIKARVNILRNFVDLTSIQITFSKLNPLNDSLLKKTFHSNHSFL